MVQWLCRPAGALFITYPSHLSVLFFSSGVNERYSPLVLTQEVVIHRHCLRTSKPLVGTTLYDDKNLHSEPNPDLVPRRLETSGGGKLL
jgi:hypothetical protein